ncbi:MAG: O-antigen ligase family protein [Ramlibacter sp.]
MNLPRSLRTPALPAPGALPKRLDLVLAIALAGYGFFLPWSVAGTSVLLAVLLLLALACAPAVWRSRPWREPTIAIGLLLFAWIALHTLLRDGTLRSLRTPLVAYKELLVAPVLYALFRLCHRNKWFWRALLAGTGGYALANWAGLYFPPLAEALAAHRIAASFEFAVVAYLVLDHAPHSATPWRWRAGAAFLAATLVFAMDGRTGQLVLVLMLMLVAWRQASPRWRVVAVLGVPLLVALAGLGSGAMQRRMAETVEAVQQVPHEPYSSSAIRIQLMRHGLILAREHWLLGGGYNHYAELHQDAVRRANADDPQRRHMVDAFWARSVNPHDEYVMQLVGGGIVSLALYLAWLGAPLLRRRPDGTPSSALVGMVVAFALGCLFNSLLMDFVEGHYYTALLAWLLARDSLAPA